MLFYYAARTQEGARLAGSVEAESAESAVGHLRARSLLVTSLEKESSPRGAWFGLIFALRRNKQARELFFRSFATLCGAGVSVRKALDAAIAQCSDSGFAEALASIAADVERGDALSDAIARHPDEFSRITRAMIRAGEESGELDRALEDIADLEERGRVLRSKVMAALAYPAVVSVTALGLVVFLVANTMPAFAVMFEQMHVALPAMTRLLIATGNALHSPASWTGALAAAAALAVSLRAARRAQGRIAFALDRLRLAIPAFGAIQEKASAARFSRTLGTLLRGGVEMVAALDAASGVVENLVYGKALDGVAGALKRGDTLLQALEASRVFDATFLQMVGTGEESGTLDRMLLRLAAFYEVDVDRALAAIGSIVEPVLICALGALIGTIVASIIVPLYSMIGSIR